MSDNLMVLLVRFKIAVNQQAAHLVDDLQQPVEEIIFAVRELQILRDDYPACSSLDCQRTEALGIRGDQTVVERDSLRTCAVVPIESGKVQGEAK